MNVGGDPGRDDYGLPPVDIEIPDDARDLDRDVHAYYRELRARRRRMMARRLYAPLSRDGMVLPLLAGCLALTLLAGTLLTVLTTGQDTVAPPRSRTTASPGTVGTRLPDGPVALDGQPAWLHQLFGGVLVLAMIPPGCRCQSSVPQLMWRTKKAGVRTYLVGTEEGQLLALSHKVGLGRSFVVVDSQGTLRSLYRPPALAAVLVRRNGIVASVWRDPVHDQTFLASLRSLARASAKKLPR